nr:uncharacterized protein LOC109181161 [Ipomoea batatas]
MCLLVSLSLLPPKLKDVWKIKKDKSLLFQRDIDVENFTASCNLVGILRSQNHLQTMTNVGPYCDMVTREFYTNLTDDIVDRNSSHFHNIYIRHCYAILLLLATNNWLPIIVADYVSKKMGKEDKVLLPFSSLIYALNVFVVSESMSIPTRPPCVSINIGVVRTRLNSTQYVLANFKSFVAQVEKIMLDDKKLLHSLEAEEQAYAPTR